jgi:hypothetical protein
MGTDNLFWKRKNQPLKRKSKNRGKPPESFLIVCEGGKTEPNYFKAFKVSSATIRVEGLGMNTLALVRETLKIRDRAKKDGMLYDQVWCVFDKDNFPMQNFNNAIDLAHQENIKVAYSNEAFELWYLLHFNYYDSGISRDRYIVMLSKLLNEPYKKNDMTMYQELLDRQADAISNADKLLKTYHPVNPGKDNPSTTVHLLVIELNKFLFPQEKKHRPDKLSTK